MIQCILEILNQQFDRPSYLSMRKNISIFQSFYTSGANYSVVEKEIVSLSQETNDCGKLCNQ